MRLWMVLALATSLAGGCCFVPSAPRPAAAGSFSPTPVSPPPAYVPTAPAAPPPPAVEVAACEVDSAYRANELAGQQQYPRGMRVLVSGTVDNVAQHWGTATVHPRRCMFAMVNLADDQAAAAAALRPGQRFQAECAVGSYLVSIAFDECRLVGP